MVHHSELTPPIWEISAVDDKQLINISWSLDSRRFLSLFTIQDVSQIYLLTISHGSSSRVFSLRDTYFNFTAPEGAPPCEVYNFSVTATYVGATYTGAGCSVPSPVLSRMLPSLPDIISGLTVSIQFLTH